MQHGLYLKHIKDHPRFSYALCPKTLNTECLFIEGKGQLTLYDLYKDKVYTTTFSGISVKFFETCLKVKPYTLITSMEIRITSTHLLIV